MESLTRRASEAYLDPDRQPWTLGAEYEAWLDGLQLTPADAALAAAGQALRMDACDGHQNAQEARGEAIAPTWDEMACRAWWAAQNRSWDVQGWYPLSIEALTLAPWEYHAGVAEGWLPTTEQD